MEIFSTASKALHAGVDFYKDAASLKLAAVLAAIQIVLLAGAIAMGIAATAQGLSAAYLQTADASSIVSTIATVLLVVVAFVIVQAFLQFALLCRAIELERKKSVQPSVQNFGGIILLVVAGGLTALLSWNEKKLLALPIVGIALLAFGAVIAPVAVIGSLMLLAYYVIVIRNCVRLFLAPAHFAENGFAGIGKSLDYSWRTTAGNALHIFAVILIIQFILAGAATLASALALIPLIGVFAVIAVSAAISAAMIFSLVYVYDAVASGK